MSRHRLNSLAAASLLLLPVLMMLAGSFGNAREFRPAYGLLGPYPNAFRPLYGKVMLLAFYASCVAPCLSLIVFVVDRARVPPPRPRYDRCASCGYDLRATPDRCPECGAAPHSSEPPWRFAPGRVPLFRPRPDARQALRTLSHRRGRPGVASPFAAARTPRSPKPMQDVTLNPRPARELRIVPTH